MAEILDFTSGTSDQLCTALLNNAKLTTTVLTPDSATLENDNKGLFSQAIQLNAALFKAAEAVKASGITDAEMLGEELLDCRYNFSVGTTSTKQKVLEELSN